MTCRTSSPSCSCCRRHQVHGRQKSKPKGKTSKRRRERPPQGTTWDRRTYATDAGAPWPGRLPELLLQPLDLPLELLPLVFPLDSLRLSGEGSAGTARPGSTHLPPKGRGLHEVGKGDGPLGRCPPAWPLVLRPALPFHARGPARGTGPESPALCETERNEEAALQAQRRKARERRQEEGRREHAARARRGRWARRACSLGCWRPPGLCTGGVPRSHIINIDTLGNVPRAAARPYGNPDAVAEPHAIRRASKATNTTYPRCLRP